MPDNPVDPAMVKYVAWMAEYNDRLRRVTSTLSRLELSGPEHFWAISEQAFILGEMDILLAMMDCRLGEKTLH